MSIDSKSCEILVQVVKLTQLNHSIPQHRLSVLLLHRNVDYGYDNSSSLQRSDPQNQSTAERTTTTTTIISSPYLVTHKYIHALRIRTREGEKKKRKEKKLLIISRGE